MDKDLHNIEDLFKSALEDNEEMPSAKLWDAVDNRLDKDNVTAIKKKYKTLKRLSLLLLLLLIALSIYELNNRHINNSLTKTNGVDKKTISVNNNDNAVLTDKNAIISKKPVDARNLNSTAPVNTIQGNPKADENTLVNRSQKQPGHSFITDKQNQKGIATKEITYVSIPLKQHLLFNIPTNNPQKAKNYEPSENKQQLSADNSSDKINNPFLYYRPLHSLPLEKINQPATNLIGTGKLSEPLTSNKIILVIDIKNTFPQQTKKKETKPSRFSITGFFSPDIASYRLEDDDVVNQPDNSDQIKKTERHEFSSTSGVRVDYELSKQWTLQSGLTFSNTNIVIEPKIIYAQADNSGNIKYRVNISSGYGYILPSFQNAPAIGDSLKVTAATHKLRYIGIPVAVKYSAGKGKLSLETMAGITVNFLTKGKLETEVQKGPNNEVDILNNIQGLKSIYLNGLAGVGAEYKLTKKLSVTMMPTARFALNPINNGAVVKTFPNSFGLTAALKTKL